MTNRRLRRVLGLLPLALVLSLPAAPAHAIFHGGLDVPVKPPVVATSSQTACAAANSSPADTGTQQLEDTILCLVNRERTKRGLKALRANNRLEGAARAHSRAMVDRNFFAHDSPGGASVLDRVKRRGYRSAGGMMVGENIAWGSGRYATPAEILDGWMNSSGHRANILHRGFDEIGVGVAVGAPRPVHGQPAATYTTDFGSRG